MTAMDTVHASHNTGDDELPFPLAWVRSRHGANIDREKAERIWREIEMPRIAEEEFGSQAAADEYYAEMQQVERQQLAEIREVERRSMGL